jgi:hypothetical protein
LSPYGGGGVDPGFGTVGESLRILAAVGISASTRKDRRETGTMFTVLAGAARRQAAW